MLSFSTQFPFLKKLFSKKFPSWEKIVMGKNPSWENCLVGKFPFSEKLPFLDITSAAPSYLPNSEPHCHKLPEISFPSLLLCKWTHNPIRFSHQLPSFPVDPLPNSDTPDLWPKSPVRTPGSSPGFSHEFYVKSCSQIFPLLLCKTGPPLSYIDIK